MYQAILNKNLYDRIVKISNNSYEYIKKKPGLDHLPDGAVRFQTLNNTHMKAVIQFNVARDLDIHRTNGLGKMVSLRLTPDLFPVDLTEHS